MLSILPSYAEPSALAARTYAERMSNGQAGSTLHTMAILQVYQAMLFCTMDETGPGSLQRAAQSD